MTIKQQLATVLRDAEFKHLHTDDGMARYYKWSNYTVNADGSHGYLYIAVDCYALADGSINVWLDKLDDLQMNQPMGNGFIHKTLRTANDVAFIAAVLDAA